MYNQKIKDFFNTKGEIYEIEQYDQNHGYGTQLDLYKDYSKAVARATYVDNQLTTSEQKEWVTLINTYSIEDINYDALDDIDEDDILSFSDFEFLQTAEVYEIERSTNEDEDE